MGNPVIQSNPPLQLLENYHRLQTAVMTHEKTSHHFKTFLHGSAVAVVGAGVIGVMNYFIRRTMALELQAQEYGFFYCAYSLIMLTLTFFDFGIKDSGTILISKDIASKTHSDGEELFSIIFLAKMFLGLISFGGAVILSPYLAEHFFNYPPAKTLFIPMASLLLLYSLSFALTAMLQALKAFRSINVLQILQTALLLAALTSLVSRFKLTAAIWIFPATTLLGITTSTLWLTFHFKYKPSLRALGQWRHSKRLFIIGRWIAISTLGLNAMYHLDTLMLTKLKDLEAVALYNVALPIMQIAQSILIFPAIFTPIVSEMWHQKNIAGIRNICRITTLALLIVFPFVLLFGYFISDNVITLLFAKKFIAAAPALTILLGGMIFFTLGAFFMNTLNACEAQKIVAIIIISAALLNVLLNFILIPPLGIVGAATATAGSYLLIFLATAVTMFHIIR